MAEPTLVITFGTDAAQQEFPLAHISVQEMLKVKTWTGLKNRRAWYSAISDEDPEALVAAFCIAKQRGGETIRFSDADFDLDELGAKFIADDREVEPVLQTDKGGAPKLDGNGLPIPVLDKTGAQTWRYVDNGDPVPPTETA